MKFRFFLSLLFPLIVFAQEKQPLTIEECIQIGMNSSKSLQISKLKAAAADAKSGETNASLLPSLKLSATYSRLSAVNPFEIQIGQSRLSISPSILNNYQARLTLSQPIFTGNRLSGTAQLSEYNAGASQEDLNKEKSQVVFDVINAYWSYYKAIEFKRSVEENLTQIQSHLLDIVNMQKQGMATTNDVLKVKVQLNNIELLLIDADNAMQLALIGLNSTLGLPLSTNIFITSSPSVQAHDTPPAGVLVEQAMAVRPELKGMELRLKASEEGVTIAKSSWYPQVMAGANYLYANPNQRIFPSKDQFNGTWDVGLSLSFDIWNWQTASYQTAQAEAARDQSQTALAQAKDAVILDVTSSYLTALKAKHKMGKAEEGVQQAEENYRVTNGKFKSGMAINSDLLDAESALLQAKVNSTAAVVDYLIALAKLDKATGK